MELLWALVLWPVFTQIESISLFYSDILNFGVTQYHHQNYLGVFIKHVGLPKGLRQWKICLRCRRPGFDPWVGKTPWRRKWQSTPVFLPRESHGQRSLVGYSPWGCKERGLSNEHMSGIQIPEPHLRSIEFESLRGPVESGLAEYFQVILVHSDVWESMFHV